MSVAGAKQREKEVFIAHQRELRTQARHRCQEALQAAAEVERVQQQFEQDASRGEYLRSLRETVQGYQEALAQVGEVEQALATARSDLERLKAGEGNMSDIAKLGKLLGSNRDLIDALQIKLTQTSETCSQARSILRQALQEARDEFAFLHRRKRQELIAEAHLSIESIFDVQALGRNHFWPEPLSVCARSVVELDKEAGYYAGRYGWPEAGGSPESLLGAIDELEQRVARTTRGMLYPD